MRLALGFVLFAFALPAHAAPETRCGWFTNPTPGNAWLTDKAGEWIIASQGGHQADGDWPPEGYGKGQWVVTNGTSYGYGCACFKVEADAKTKMVRKILSATAKPLAACRDDKALAAAEKKMKG